MSVDIKRFRKVEKSREKYREDEGKEEGKERGKGKRERKEGKRERMSEREEGRKEGEMNDALKYWKKERRGTKNINVKKKKQNKKDFQRNI